VRNSLAMLKKELRSYFASTIAYVVIAIFLAVVGYFFSVFLFNTSEASLSFLFLNTANVLLLVAPLLTMRLLAEEQRMGTIELLLTAPVRDWEVVVGKWLAAFVVVIVMIALTLYSVIIIFTFGNPDPGPIITGYLAVLLLGAALLAIGMLATALSQNQLVAAVIAFGTSLLLWNINALAKYVGTPWKEIVNYIALSQHFLNFTQGVIQARDVLYYVSLVVAFLFVATRVVEKRRWE
jgi:ABC-2 type transport system permease protein